MPSTLTSNSPRTPSSLTSNSPRTPSSSAAWSTAAPSSSTAIASSSSEHLQVDGGEPSPDPEPSPPSIVAAPNLGAGGNGEVAALTHSSTQKAASHLIRRGRTTCGADHICGEKYRERMKGAREETWVGQASVRERESLQVLGVLRATRLVLGVLLARCGRRELRRNRGCTYKSLQAEVMYRCARACGVHVHVHVDVDVHVHVHVACACIYA